MSDSGEAMTEGFFIDEDSGCTIPISKGAKETHPGLVQMSAREYSRLNARMKRMEESLKFYATNDIHSINFDWKDNGERAREALREPEKSF